MISRKERSATCSTSVVPLSLVAVDGNWWINTQIIVCFIFYTISEDFMSDQYV